MRAVVEHAWHVREAQVLKNVQFAPGALSFGRAVEGTPGPPPKS